MALLVLLYEQTSLPLSAVHYRQTLTLSAMLYGQTLLALSAVNYEQTSLALLAMLYGQTSLILSAVNYGQTSLSPSPILYMDTPPLFAVNYGQTYIVLLPMFYGQLKLLGSGVCEIWTNSMALPAMLYGQISLAVSALINQAESESVKCSSEVPGWLIGVVKTFKVWGMCE